jgi:TadE-like protein
MDRPNCSDRDARGLVSRITLLKDRCARGRESGQAMVEFALILLPLLLLVSGIIWFGIGLNFWLDMNRVANQGARWAVVNCGPPAVASKVCTPSLEQYLEDQALSQGDTFDAEICYETMTGSPAGTAGVGDPVTVRLTNPDFDLVPLLGIEMDLVASASMRLEQVPTLGGLDTAGLCP